MNLQDLKIGDTIKHYCSGLIVTGKVIEVKNDGVITEHEPVQWGRDIYTKTGVYPSSYLQKKWGGTDESGQPCKSKYETTPAAWYNDEILKSPITH